MKPVQDVCPAAPVCVSSELSTTQDGEAVSALGRSAHFTLHSTLTFLLDVLQTLEATCA